MSDKLYTWVDVQNALRDFQTTDRGATLLQGKSFQAFWDGLHIYFPENEDANSVKEAQNKAKGVLSEIFLARYNSTENKIVLGETHNIQLPVFFEQEPESEIPKEHFRAEFSPLSYIADKSPYNDQREKQDNEPVTVAFHSFKGGVGRTLHAITLAQHLCNENKKVLLIDADFEAPGISWYFPNPAISYADFIAMVHSDYRSDSGYALENAKAQIPQNGTSQNLFVLPAFRETNYFGEPVIKPEHLNTYDAPFRLQDATILLGQTLGVDYIIVDLRAGISELSAGWLLDPKVFKVFVTTLSGQSLRGTQFLLGKIQSTYNQFLITNKDNLIPFIIFSQVPIETLDTVRLAWIKDESYYNNDFINLRNYYISLFDHTDESSFVPWEETTHFSIEYSSLKALNSNWEKVIKQIESTDILDKIKLLASWIPSSSIQPTISNDSPVDTQNSLDERRQKLSEVANSLITADSTTVDDFLVTTSINQLATRHINSLPAVVIVGAKGSGKTYLFKSLNSSGNWQTFVSKVKQSPTKDIITADFCKITSPINIRSEERTSHDHLIRDFINESLKKSDLSISDWRKIWLDVIAWANGKYVKEIGAWDKAINSWDRKVICLFDGLEEYFSEYYSQASHKTALRSLLQEVPSWIESLPSRPLGVIIFIRQDIINYVISQNIEQFLDKHKTFRLKWSETEALRLACWVSKKSEALPAISNDDIVVMERMELETVLYEIWGRRLGKNTSREAGSATWILSALSNLQEEVQSRDIVRFLYVASEKSINEPSKKYYNDRLLIPTSIRTSITEVGRSKIDEVRQENPLLHEILFKIQSRSPELRFPCNKSDLAFLAANEQDMLDTNGVLRERNNEYYLAEIFRRGLGISYSKAGKPRML